MISVELLKQLFAFGLVGVVATGVHYGVALTLTELFSVSIYLANLVGFCSAVLVSLLGHSTLTFKASLNPTIVKRFVFVALAALAVSETVLALLQNFFALHHRIALAIVVMIIPIATFVINKFWVYADCRLD